MRLRVVVVAAFVAMAAVPAYFAWATGFMPGPTQASAVSTGILTSSSASVTSLAWPKQPLGLAAAGSRVYWEQRDPSSAVSGLWYYDASTRRVERLLDRKATGRSSGFPVAAGDLVVWQTYAAKRGQGTTSIQAYDGLSGRRWQVAAAGVAPAAAGGAVIWAEPAGAGDAHDAIRGVDSVTDAEYKVSTDGSVRVVAASGRRLAWITGAGPAGEVWAGSFTDPARYRLAGRGTAVALDGDRVVWATAVGRHSTAIVAWDRSARQAKVLERLAGTTSSLTLTGRYAAWVTTRQATGPQVWVYDFGTRKTYPVSTAGGRQVSPVIVGGSVYWAGDRTGHWALYARSLQH